MHGTDRVRRLGRHTLRRPCPTVIPAQAGILADTDNRLFLQNLSNAKKDSRLRGNDETRVFRRPLPRVGVWHSHARGLGF
ncbi:hypothetical protein HMPREF9123_0145 [Neisseria bacilliformis ATCC BAA-1200]|uniref:Uncharacterized protein n=1 Tax=Neisseria bacilliformis ATCC BAA-1200 TaxID=888742 RepID=F2B8X0_9NEIS|nr:hypothetical protein HMPREF9123_0145 [Neisseria bacilliformis ATCC BAA-1200]